jgi:hypothetical protein
MNKDMITNDLKFKRLDAADFLIDKKPIRDLAKKTEVKR